jgi:hypothetical protein
MNLDERKFDPDQPRDEEGKRTSGGDDGGGTAEAKPAASGLIFKDYDGNAPAAVTVVTGDPQLDQALSVYTDTIGEFVGEQCGQTRYEVQAAVAPLQEAIVALKLKLAELTGAVDVLRGKEPPPPAKFPRVKAWMEDTIYHEGDIVAFAGGTFQARRDTASPPGAKDWVCLAKPGSSLSVRGTYDSCIDYRCLDIAVINGSSFVALKDSPGACPGDGWQLLCSRGSRGERGFKGERGFIGPRGECTPIIKSWQIDRATYSATPIMADGSAGPALELRPLFEQFVTEREAGGA